MEERIKDYLVEIAKEEMVNRGVLVEIKGVLKHKRDWCAEYGISTRVYDHRVNNEKMTPYEALTTPLHKKTT